jgi:hypothetical protein
MNRNDWRRRCCLPLGRTPTKLENQSLTGELDRNRMSSAALAVPMEDSRYAHRNRRLIEQQQLEPHR